ncbi:MAG TPA: hypothetical protein VFV31_06340 [Chitinophagaceae bacterium]|nr:hypothetical protein [Chitinophagaceae bacterium]
MKIVSKILILFLTQIILEVIIMVLLAKFGIPYMDFDTSGEGVPELVMGIGYYYSFSKGIIVILPYILLMIFGAKVLKKISLTQLNSIISVLLTAAFWLIFANPVKELLNPMLGSLMAALFILIVVRIGSSIGAKS